MLIKNLIHPLNRLIYVHDYLYQLFLYVFDSMQRMNLIYSVQSLLIHDILLIHAIVEYLLVCTVRMFNESIGVEEDIRTCVCWRF